MTFCAKPHNFSCNIQNIKRFKTSGGPPVTSAPYIFHYIPWLVLLLSSFMECDHRCYMSHIPVYAKFTFLYKPPVMFRSKYLPFEHTQCIWYSTRPNIACSVFNMLYIRQNTNNSKCFNPLMNMIYRNMFTYTITVLRDVTSCNFVDWNHRF